MSVERKSFGRVVRLYFSNFTTNKAYYIDESLRISFNFLKSFDESTESSKGQITIYGLTEQTADKLATTIQTGGYFTTEVKCDVGYSADEQNIKTLFYAIVSDISFKKNGGTSETIINVNANIRDLNLSGYYSFSLGTSYLKDIAKVIQDTWGYTTEINLLDYSEEEERIILSYYTAYRFLNYSVIGTLDDFLRKLGDEMSFSYTLENDKKHIVFKPRDNYRDKLLHTAKTKVSEFLEVGGSSSQAKISSLYTTSNSEQSSKIVLSPTTGLFGFPYLSNKNITVAYNQTLQENEELNKVKDAKVKVKKNGKTKITLPKTKKVSRRFLTAVAFINPNIKPNKQIQIKNASDKVDGEYRCRSCKFTGDTHEGDFIVEMELEDTNGFSIAIPEKEESFDGTNDSNVEINNVEENISE